MGKPRGRPFEPGNNFGRGRPKGSGNRKPANHLVDDYSEHLLRKCVALAMEGNMQAMRMCIDLINPARRAACVKVNLPQIETVQDVNQAAEKVTRAIRRGDLSPSEGQTLINVLEGRSRLIEKLELEGRIATLENTLGGNRSRDPDRSAPQNTRTGVENEPREGGHGRDRPHE